VAPSVSQSACPAGIDVPSYVALIGQGRHEEAVDIIRQDNPFPWVCGLVCPAPCETRCQRSAVDSSISIRALKGFAAKAVLRRNERYRQAIKTRRPERVAIVGSGPAGLSAAYYLAVEGYDITVFEALSQAGGMLRTGIPAYRLPRAVLDSEIDNIRSLGVQIRTGTPIGSGLTIHDLFARGCRAVFLSTGAHKSARLGVPGEGATGVVHGIAYLRGLSLDEPVREGRKVVVIGGGNAAIDAARSALRKGAEQVTILYRRTRQEMPAYEPEIEDAIDEGIAIRYLAATLEIFAKAGEVVGLRCVRMELGDPDVSGRRRPLPVSGSAFALEADLVIPAIGQVPDMAFAYGLDGLQITAQGTIQADPCTLATSVEGVFAGGDLVSGPATVIEGIAAGKKAAVSIDAFIRGVERPQDRLAPLRRATVERAEVPEELIEQLRRPEIPTLPLAERKTTFTQVEIGLTEKMARDEGRRCLRCDLS